MEFCWNKKKNLDNLTMWLMAEEVRLQEQEGTHEASMALTTKSKFGNKRPKNDKLRHSKSERKEESNV